MRKTAIQDKTGTTSSEQFARKRESYFRKLAALQDRVIARPAEWPQRPIISDEQRRVYGLAVCDILDRRFRRIMKDKKIDVDQFARELYDVGGNDYWFSPEYTRDYHPDGSYTPQPRCRLLEFIEGELSLPPEAELRLLEMALGYEPNQILTNYFFDQDDKILDFLVAHNYLNEQYRETHKLRKSRRVKGYNRKKEDAAKQQREAMEQFQKDEAERKKEKKETFLTRLRNLALGEWNEPIEENVYEEV